MYRIYVDMAKLIQYCKVKKNNKKKNKNTKRKLKKRKKRTKNH